MTKKLKRMIIGRKDLFRRNKKRTNAWKIKKAETDREIRLAKKRYFDKAVDKLTEEGSHRIPYRALQKLKCHDKPTEWDIRDLRPGQTDQEMAKELASFFNDISKEFRPLNDSDVPKANKLGTLKLLQPKRLQED